MSHTLDLTHPFTRQQARSAGIKDSLLKGPQFRTVFRGVYVAAEVPHTLALRCRAAVLLHPDPVWIDGVTAAALQGLPVPHTPDIHVLVTSLAHRRVRPGLRHRLGATSSRAQVEGVPVVAGAELFARSAHLPLVDLVVLGDALVHRCHATVQQIGDVAGSQSLRRTAALVRRRAESPMETRLRLLLVLAGFPEPLVNPTVDGRYRVDLCWAKFKLVVEYDGVQHRADLDQWDHDIERNEWFERHGWRIVHVISRDVYRRPAELIDRVESAWLAAGGPRLRRSDAWRAHFPDR